MLYQARVKHKMHLEVDFQQKKKLVKESSDRVKQENESAVGLLAIVDE